MAHFDLGQLRLLVQRRAAARMVAAVVAMLGMHCRLQRWQGMRPARKLAVPLALLPAQALLLLLSALPLAQASLAQLVLPQRRGPPKSAARRLPQARLHAHAPLFVVASLPPRLPHPLLLLLQLLLSRSPLGEQAPARRQVPLHERARRKVSLRILGRGPPVLHLEPCQLLWRSLLRW